MYRRDFANTQLAEIPDSVLVRQAATGDQDAFEILVCRYNMPLFNFIHRTLGDYEQSRDVLQHVFFQLYLSIPKLSTNLSTRRTKEPVKAWLFQVAWNRCIDEHRKKRPLLFCELDGNEREADKSQLETIPDPHPEPEEIAEYTDLQDTLMHAICTLPPKFRVIVFLRYAGQMSFWEIGQRLNIPENTAKTYFQRARPLLRTALSPHVS